MGTAISSASAVVGAGAAACTRTWRSSRRNCQGRSKTWPVWRLSRKLLGASSESIGWIAIAGAGRESGSARDYPAGWAAVNP